MKTIIVATDLSATAQNAALYAAEMAVKIKADIILLYTYQLPVVDPNFPAQVDLQAWQEDAENAVADLRKYLEQQTKNLVKITIEVSLGSLMVVLKELCERVNPYAVVIGSTGKTAAEKVLFGSNAIYIMKHLEWPAIMVPPSSKFNNIAKIGLAFDFDNMTDIIPVEEINLLVSDLHAELHVLNIGKKEVYNPQTTYGSHTLEEMFADAKPVFHFISGNDAGQGIMDFAERIDIDLLIVLPRRYRFIEQIIHKSHTKQFVLHSRLPLMTLHAKKKM